MPSRSPPPLYRDTDWKREKSTAKVPWRSEARRDYARLIHSSAFRRLQGKTQLFPGNESDFFRNRLTHSLEVAQIATAIGSKLNYEIPYFRKNKLDLDVLEFAGIAHDLGHPPFGHNGEKALDDRMKKYGGFEGNAQTLRILSRLEKKEMREWPGVRADGTDSRLGLNLSYRVLASILKYDHVIPLKRTKRDKLVKGYYESETALVSRIKRAVIGQDASPFKTVECQIMDIADDIAYSTYDLEDAFKVGFLSPLRILELSTSSDEIASKIANELSDKGFSIDSDGVVRELLDLFSSVFDRQSIERELVVIESYKRSRNLRDGHYRTALTSKLVDIFISGVRVTIDERRPQLSKVFLDPPVLTSVEVLKRFTFEALIESPMLKLVEFRGYEIVARIFDTLAGDAGHKLLPDDCRRLYARLEHEVDRMRLVSDFIAGMTDRYALEFYGRLTSHGESIFKPVS